MRSTPSAPALTPAPAKSQIQNPNSEIPLPQSEVPVPKSEIPLPADADPSDAALAEVFGIPLEEPAFLSQKHAAAVRAGRSLKALVAASLGGLSILLSFLALIDAFWTKIPATLVGFAAILLGMQAASEIRHSAGRQSGRNLAIAGIVCGVVGIFLGPLILAAVGRRL